MTKANRSILRAVLTGDVVESSRLGREERRSLPSILKRAARDLRKAFPQALLFDLEIFRGDSWQMIISDPALSLRAGLFFRAGVIAASPPAIRLDTRISIAVEQVDFVPAGNVSEGDGPAYRASGEALDALDEQSRMTLGAPGQPASLGVMICLLDAIVQEWTARQARIVQGRLQGWTQAEIAGASSDRITQQTVGRHLARAHWPAVDLALRHIEDSLRKL